MRVRQHYDPTGRHRLVINTTVGDWAAYDKPALLEIEGQLYIGFTEYWSGPLEGAVFQLMRKRSKQVAATAAS